MSTVDLFAGAGGWSLALRDAGVREVGVEWDPDACATARAAGHLRVQADVAALDPVDFAVPRGPFVGVVGSPPCQSYSSGGKQLGRADTEHVQRCVDELAAGRDTRARHAKACADARSILVVEPLRWALALRPEWIALEQVPAVLPLWEQMAGVLRGAGYSAWAGLVYAEQYGVPQTRTRAILIASCVRDVAAPEPTHRRYYPPNHARRQAPTFEDLMLAPWISMAEALGWDEADAAGFPRRNDRGDGLEYRERDLRAATEPAFGLTEKARSWTHVTMRASARSKAAVRPADEPAPTITAGRDFRERAWTFDRPATTISGDPRVQPPGHKINEADRRAGRTHYDGRAGKNAIRVTLDEAAIIQTFPAGYPWAGTRTKQFQQVGNAIPPRLAAAVLRAVV